MIGSHRLGAVAVLALIALGVSSSPARGQSLTHGAIDGFVRDVAGVPLDDAGATLRDLATGAEQSAITAIDGRFRFVLLPAGEYELLIERFGYRPVQMSGVQVGAGRRLDLPVALTATDQPAMQPDTVFLTPSLLGGTGPDVAQQFGRTEMIGLPEPHRDLSWLSGLSSAGDSGLELQGLPSYFHDVVIDGLPAMRMRHPGSAADRHTTVPAALTLFDRAELVVHALDVEWPSRSGGLLAGHTRRGSRDFRVEGFGNWSTMEASGVGSAAPGGDPYGGIQGGALVSGPIVPDTSSFVFAIEGWRLEAPPRTGTVPDSLALLASTVASDSFGVSLPDQSRRLRSDAVSGFLRVDWQLAAAHSLTLRSSFALAPEGVERTVFAAPPFREDRYDGRHLSIGVEVTSRLGDRVAQQIRFAAEHGSRSYGSAGPAGDLGLTGAAAATTRILEGGWSLGSDPALTGDLRQSAVQASETLYLAAGPHHLKFGLGASLRSYEYGTEWSRSSEFLFSGIEGFAGGRGLFSQTTSGASPVDFEVPQLAAFVQDNWRAAPGLDLLAGVRFAAEALPGDQVTPNPEWVARTGIGSTILPRAHLAISPRFGFVWDLQDEHRWLLSGAVGLFSGSVDPALLSEILTYDGDVEVRRGVGALPGWPLVPDSAVAPVLGPRLALLAPGYTAPRTLRGTIGVSRQFGSQTALHLSLAYRHTDFLPRRHDLNLLPLPLSRDQNGRPIFARLSQAGGLLVAENGSNRRFPGFEQVTAVNVDGWSTYGGVTVAAEHRAGPWSFFASYTRARTRDNWLLGRGMGPDLLPFANDEGSGWEVGTSDLDAPHRGVIGAELAMPWLPVLRLGALYRYASGYPFTPGFRDGVDINGDGSATNDPAFVADDLPEIEALLGNWPCLGNSAGGFAVRNSCRGRGDHRFDLRINLDIARTREHSLAIVVDGLNLLASELVIPDRALYVLDPDGALHLDRIRGETIVPLRINEKFGQPLVRLSGSRLLRVGLRVNY